MDFSQWKRNGFFPVEGEWIFPVEGEWVFPVEGKLFIFPVEGKLFFQSKEMGFPSGRGWVPGMLLGFDISVAPGVLLLLICSLFAILMSAQGQPGAVVCLEGTGRCCHLCWRGHPAVFPQSCPSFGTRALRSGRETEMQRDGVTLPRGEKQQGPD